MLFCYAVGCSGYFKSTVFDLAFFKVLFKGFLTRKFSIIKAFFTTRSKATAGKAITRANMRQYFILRLFWFQNKFNTTGRNKFKQQAGLTLGNY